MARRSKAPRLWIRVDLGADDKIGPGKIALLRAVGEERSISGAARALGMSYRRAWLLIDALNRSFGAPVVETHVGGRRQGGARLTPLGAELIARYADIERRANQSAGTALTSLSKLRRRR